MKLCGIFLAGAAACLLATGANAQSRGTGWEFGADLIYQGSQDVDFDGGSTASFQDDIGVSLFAGYRLNDRLEFHFGLDWATVDYDATIPFQIGTGPIGSIGVKGDMEAFTPRVDANFNFMEGPFTPYITAGIGYSFIDTNIPNGPPQGACWWDPWFGNVCSTYQPTKSTDAFTYDVGLGVRWDMSPGYSMRLAYEKHWLDVSTASSAPDFDQFKLGIIFRY